MIWTAVVRAGAVLSMIVAVKDLHDLATREIEAVVLDGLTRGTALDAR